MNNSGSGFTENEKKSNVSKIKLSESLIKMTYAISLHKLCVLVLCSIEYVNRNDLV